MHYLEFQNSEFKNWEDVFSKPSKITVKTLKTGTIISKVAGLINLKNPGAKDIQNGRALLPVLAHVIQHPVFGAFLVDTGFDSLAEKTPGGSFKGWIKSWYFKNRYLVKKGEGIDEQLCRMCIRLNALFLTHAHEHISGIDSLPEHILRFCGEGEKDENYFPLVYSDFFRRHEFQYIDFSKAHDMPIAGNAVDIFGDGSFWAISTPGHTKGHISYLVNCEEQPILLTGDACVTEKGYLSGVETGKFSKDPVMTRESFLKIKEFASAYPEIKVVFGHECEDFKIEYI